MKTYSAAEVLRRRILRGDSRRAQEIEAVKADLDVASQLYELRLREGLSQAELAKRVHTSPSVISRLEDAEYKGHSLGMLRKIAKALGREVRVVFVEKSAPSKRDAPRASSSRAKRRTPAKRKR